MTRIWTVAIICFGLGVATAWIVSLGVDRGQPVWEETVREVDGDDTSVGRTLEQLVDDPTFEMISMVRDPGFSLRPSYEVRFVKDGGAEFVGRNAVAHIGEFRGSVANETFARLTMAAQRLGVQQMEEFSGPPGIDTPSTSVTLVIAQDGSEHRVLRYEHTGSLEFWMFTEILDGVAKKVAWR